MATWRKLLTAKKKSVRNVVVVTARKIATHRETSDIAIARSAAKIATRSAAVAIAARATKSATETERGESVDIDRTGTRTTIAQSERESAASITTMTTRRKTARPKMSKWGRVSKLRIRRNQRWLEKVLMLLPWRMMPRRRVPVKNHRRRKLLHPVLTLQRTKTMALHQWKMMKQRKLPNPRSKPSKRKKTRMRILV